MGRYFTIILLISCSLILAVDWDGLYGVISIPTESFFGSTETTIDDDLSSSYINPPFFKSSPNYGIGYHWKDNDVINNAYFTMIINQDIGTGYDYSGGWSDSYNIYGDSFTFGYGKGYTHKSMNILLGVEYTAANIYDWFGPEDSELHHYLNINLGIGLGKKTEWGYLGLSENYYPSSTYFGSDYNAQELRIEVPYKVVGAGLVVAGVIALIWAAAETGEYPSFPSSSSSSSPSSPSSNKGCHVYGKIKFVEHGEDYKVKFVSYGEDLAVEYVNLVADSPGEWDVVDYGEDYKIKIVENGEDFKVNVVFFGAGCK